MMIKRKLPKLKFVILGFLVLLLALSPVTPVFAQDVGLGHGFYGTVEIGGEGAETGSVISARIGETEYGGCQVTTAGQYALIVQGEIDDGATISFYINGQEADGQTFPFHDGWTTQLDLSVPAAPPGAPNTVTLTANPDELTADGSSTSTLTATVKDQYGNNVADDTDVVFNTNHGTLGSSTVTKQTTNGVATATLTSESSTETIIATVTATANGVKGATSVFFTPAGGTGVEESKTEIVTGDGTVDASDTVTGIGDISINAAGDHTVTTAKYEGNPGGTPTFQSSGNYYDVHLDDDTGVNSLTINFCPATEGQVIYYWNGTSWVAASNQAFAGGCITVTITATTTPRLADLTGAVFGSSAPAPAPPVGGGGGGGGGAAAFSPAISNLTITPAEGAIAGVRIGEIVTITTAVENTGGGPGSYTVTLKINGVVEEEKTVTLAAYAKKTVTFTVIREEAGTYKIEVNGLEGEFIVPELPAATFETTNLSISPAKVKVGETVTISILVAETSGVSGSYDATLKINGTVVEKQEVALGPQQSQTVTFTIAEKEAGSYKVEVNGLVSEFIVEEPAPEAPPPAPAPPPAKAINWWLIGGIIAAVVVGLAVFLLLRKRAA